MGGGKDNRRTAWMAPVTSTQDSQLAPSIAQDSQDSRRGRIVLLVGKVKRLSKFVARFKVIVPTYFSLLHSCKGPYLNDAYTGMGEGSTQVQT